MSQTPGQTLDASFSRIEAVANENKQVLATILTELREVKAVVQSNAARLDKVEKATRANTEVFARMRGALGVPRRDFKVEARATTTDEVIRAWLEKVEFGERE